MFCCFDKIVKYYSNTEEDDIFKKETDLYRIIEKEIFYLTGNADMELIINEIIICTNNKQIGYNSLNKILTVHFPEPAKLIKLFCENFIFISAPNDHIEALRKHYNDFNIELIIIGQINLLPSEKENINVFIEHIKDISFEIPKFQNNKIKFNSLSLIFFFLLFCENEKSNFEKKSKIIFNLLDTKSCSYIIGNNDIFVLMSVFVKVSLFFIDNEFNMRLKKEAVESTNTDFFSNGKLQNIIFFKKILIIYHNFSQSFYDDLVLYFIHNMIFSTLYPTRK